MTAFLLGLSVVSLIVAAYFRGLHNGQVEGWTDGHSVLEEVAREAYAKGYRDGREDAPGWTVQKQRQAAREGRQ